VKEDGAIDTAEPLAQLLARCRARDGAAVAVLVGRFESGARDLARAWLRDGALAEDAVQEAFVTALARLNQLREPEAFPGWFRQIVRTHANRLSRKRHEAPLSAGTETVDQRGTAAGVLLRDELHEQVRRALDALPRAGREAAQLFYLDELSCRQVAAELGIPAGTVRRRLHDARRRLRGMLLGYVRDGGGIRRESDGEGRRKGGER